MRVVAVADGLEDGPLGIELLALLIVVGDLHVRSPAHLAGVRRLFAEQQPQQGRLAGAVRADETDAIAAQDPGREADRRRVGRRTPSLTSSTSKTRRPDASACSDLHADAADGRRAARRALLAHRHQRPHASLVAGPPRFDAPPQPDFFLRQPLVELLLRDGLVREPLLLLSQERRIVARPRRQRARDRFRRSASPAAAGTRDRA